MIIEKILKINNILKKYKENILKKASSEEIKKFQQWIISKYGEIDVAEYINLVEISNGLEFNGLDIYSIKSKSSNSIYNSNDIWHENEDLRTYLFFADSDISWYCFDINNNFFCELDKACGDIMQTYKSFNEMINSALDSVI